MSYPYHASTFFLLLPVIVPHIRLSMVYTRETNTNHIGNKFLPNCLSTSSSSWQLFSGQAGLCASRQGRTMMDFVWKIQFKEGKTRANFVRGTTWQRGDLRKTIPNP